MARDAELDRLKSVQQAAFERQQSAYQVQQRAWEQRSSAREVMNRAFAAKDRAYKAQESSWSNYRGVKSSHGSRIDDLNGQHDRAYQNMRASFDQASAAYDRRDGASARSFADQARIYQAEMQGHVAERRRLVEEIRSARAQHEPYQRAFQEAKAVFDAARERFNTAKAEHERAQVKFKEAKAEQEEARAAFSTRLEKVRAERKSDNRSIAQKAGVPSQYWDDVRVSKDVSGNTNIYFGGIGEPDGPGHGHYVLDRMDKVTYRRDPFDSHGSQNFTSNQANYFDAVRTESASGSGEFGFSCLYKGIPAYVETSYDNQTGRQKISIYYGGLGGPLGQGHGHAIAYRDNPATIIEDRPPR